HCHLPGRPVSAQTGESGSKNRRAVGEGLPLQANGNRCGDNGEATGRDEGNAGIERPAGGVNHVENLTEGRQLHLSVLF
ncbi:MAG: hypothetical protein MJA27_33910, partial [Pseudanabaenales cyanobacterium]|nr:hypothetical protein [Pseudanabaenales cyanobacterium]